MASDSWFTFLFATTSKFDIFVQNDTRTEQVEKQLLVIYEGSKKEILWYIEDKNFRTLIVLTGYSQAYLRSESLWKPLADSWAFISL